MQNGRPSKLTPETHNRIVAAIQRGAYIETAAQLAGISKETFYQWLKKGRAIADEQEPCITPHHEALRNFSDAVNKALAESEIRDLTAIDTAAQQGTWQAAAWKLERKHHSRWGRKVAVTDNEGGNFFAGMAKAWAEAIESDTDDQFIEGELASPRIGRSNGNTR